MHNVFYSRNKYFIEYCYLLPIDSGGVECDFASARVNTFHLQSKCAFEKMGIWYINTICTNDAKIFVTYI